MITNRQPVAPIPHLDDCDRTTLRNYFEEAWALEETLMRSLSHADTFYTQPDPLRNPLIFYLGHSAAFYINKLIQVGLLTTRINPTYETLFEIGVDPSSAAELEAATLASNWPAVDDVWAYRDQAKGAIADVIHTTALDLPIHQNHPLWALMMGIEHSRIHFETSSMLLRQLPVTALERPDGWHYAASQGPIRRNTMVEVPTRTVNLGKPVEASTYGWDSDYGRQQVHLQPFAASQYLITNGEFLQFVTAGGYETPEYWDTEAWQWKTDHQIHHPKFWIPTEPNGFQYRAMFNQIDLPLDWPVEVNHYEATAYCRWQGQGMRLMTEAEWISATADAATHDYNLNLKFGSPSPVGGLESDPAPFGLYDLQGNVWEWLSDDFAPLPGFQAHPLYTDYSAPFFDQHHKMLRGGAWASTGTYTASRNWFRRNFYQHAGFRIAHTCD